MQFFQMQGRSNNSTPWRHYRLPLLEVLNSKVRGTNWVIYVTSRWRGWSVYNSLRVCRRFWHTYFAQRRWRSMRRLHATHVWLESVGQMLGSGLDIRRAAVAAMGEGKVGKELAARTLGRVEAGASLTPAFQDFLTPEHLLILRASEQAGTFADGLLSVAKRIDEQLEWKRTISRSIAYPSVLLISCYVLALFVRFEVDPMLRQLVASLTVSHDHMNPIVTLAANLPVMMIVLLTCGAVGLPLIWA